MVGFEPSRADAVDERSLEEFEGGGCNESALASAVLLADPLTKGINLSLTMRVQPDFGAARWSAAMSDRAAQADGNLLSAFALMMGGTVIISLPLTLVIIWICG